MLKIGMMVLSIFLVGCSTIQREESLGAQQFERLDLAIKQVKPLADIGLGSIKKVRVGDVSPMYESEKIKGRFEVLNVKALEAADFSMSVVGRCGCAI
jgi:glycyl-tRNA synthetase alpha subunit